MRTTQLSALLVAATVAAAAAQSTAPESASKPPKSITLTGCVGEDAGNAGHYTLTDFSSGLTTYRLTGTDVRKYLGRRVQLIGAAQPPKLAIVGGLTPNPNIAAQAGAIDPTRAAMAAQGAEGNAQPGSIEVPVLKVRSVRAVAGSCAKW
jgi:hypothetical protein